mmetsp:Transcript_22473/g.38321  ORF Transcript_22473/g.38321 Transcript_22473/m.38321 type:complete len:80 (-) Transcript_22473:202-441(-)
MTIEMNMIMMLICHVHRQNNMISDAVIRLMVQLFHDDIYVNTLCLQFNQGLSPQYYAFPDQLYVIVNYELIEVPQQLRD